MLPTMKPETLCRSLVKARAGARESNDAARALRVLYELAQLDCPADAGLLGRALGIASADARGLLIELDARGLVCAQRARLTMLGLGRAARVASLHLERVQWVAELRGACAPLAPSTGLRRLAL